MGVSIVELAARTGYSYDGLLKLCNSGEIKAEKVGTRWEIDEEEADRLIPIPELRQRLMRLHEHGMTWSAMGRAAVVTGVCVSSFARGNYGLRTSIAVRLSRFVAEVEDGQVPREGSVASRGLSAADGGNAVVCAGRCAHGCHERDDEGVDEGVECTRYRAVAVGNVPIMPVMAGKEQALKPLEEAAELFAAWQNGNIREMRDEAADVIQAVCNLLASYEVTDMTHDVYSCFRRNVRRGREYVPR